MVGVVFTRSFYALRLLLAVGAPVSRSLTLRELFDGFAADTAGLAVALVDVELLAEVARVAIGTDVIAQRRAADLHRHGQCGFDGARELRAFRARQRPGLAARTNARAEQRFARVDVADADHEP